MNNKRVNKRKFIPPAFSNINTKFELLSIEATLKLASELIQAHKLNKDQAAALIQIAQMMASRQSVEEAKELATHTRILAWEVSWTEEPDGLQSMRLQKSGIWLSD